MLSGRSRRATRWRSVAAVLLVLVLLPAGSSLFRTGPPAPVPAPDSTPVHTPPVEASARPAPDGTGEIPGSDPAAERFVAAPTLALEILKREANGTSAAAPSPDLGHPSATAPRAVPRELQPLSANGTLIGHVADRETGRPIQNASVVLSLITGGCPGYLCPFAATTASGSFSLVGPADTYLMTITASNYTTNDSQVGIVAGQVSSLGTIYLLEDAYVTGVVLGSDPTHEPVDLVSVVGSSRNSALTGQQALTDGNGTFVAQVPSGADRIDFGPPGYSPYEANHTFADPQPGQTVDLGTIYLVRGTQLNLRLLDRVTHQPIGPAFGSEEIACQAQTGDCPLPDTITSGPNVTVFAVPGPTQLHTIVEGYVVNFSAIGVVPVLPESGSIPVDVNVTPLGVIELTPGVVGGLPTEGGNTTGYDDWWYGVTVPSNSNITGLDLCSLDGVDVGVPLVFAPGFQPDICFPGIVSEFGGSMYAVGPPLRDWLELGSFQGIAPMIQNETWVNLTPDRLTQVGYLNFTPGAYIYGQVFYAGTTTSPASFTVQACSSDEGSICGPVSRFPWSSSPFQKDIDADNASLVGCPTGPSDFCVAAPPGPVELTVAGGNFSENLTWAEVPYACCAVHPGALALNEVTSDRVRSINVTASEGAVYGKVVAGPGEYEPPLDELTIEICPVAPDVSSCTPGLVQGSTFLLPAPLGWDDVTFQAAGYETNETWIDVNGTDPTGTIVLTPLATIAGQILDPNGTGIAGSVLQYCPLALASPPQPGCQTLQSPPIGSSGYFVGTVPGGPYPGSTYGLSASASGYLTNFTWFNATPGDLLSIPPIILTPVGNGTAPAPAASAAPRPSGTPGTWVVGRLLNANSGVGVEGAILTACTYSGSVCVGFNDLTGTGGQFNQSVPLGKYHLFASKSGYSEGEFYLNATGTATVDLGDLSLAPYPFVSGRVAISPWLSYSKNAGFGPGAAAIEICNSGRTECGVSTQINTAGAFNITAPPGVNDALTVNGTGGSPFDGITAQYAQGGGSQGWLSNLTPVTVNSSDVRLSQAPGAIPVLGLFATEQGVLYDGSSPRGPSGTPLEPARWATVVTRGSEPGSDLTMFVGGGGNYTFLVPPSENLLVIGSGLAFLSANVTSTVGAPTESNGFPVESFVDPLVLPHYGWIQGHVLASSGVSIPGASVSVRRADPVNRTTISVGGTADLDGYINLTAPPGSIDNLTVSAAGFVGLSTSVSVLPSTTTRAAPWRLTPTYTVEYVRSLEVNDVAVPPTVTLVDPVERTAVSGTSLELLDRYATLQAVTTSNGLGQFLLAGPNSSVATLSIFRSGYAAESLPVPTPVQGTVVYPTVNITGDGVLAGRVVAAPRSTPTAGVNVTACEVFPSGGCETATSNGIGLVWFEVPPGDYELNISAEGFTVATTFGAEAVTDTWAWVGNLTVTPDAIVSGHVLGDPFELPIMGANVTLCPANGSFSINCEFTTPTDLTGGFAIPSPPGLFVLNVSAPGFGLWSLEVEVTPGQQLDLGEITLEPDGGIFGAVIDAETGAPIEGASVSACPSDGGACAGPVVTNVTGDYLLPPLDPGLATLDASANGFSPTYRAEDVPAGGTLVAKPVGLYPVGVLPQYNVTGRVVWNGTGTGIPGATVSADYVGGGFGQATVSRPNGTFLLSLIRGPYHLSASAPGAVERTVDLSVGNASVAGLVLPLNRSTYPVSGTVLAEGSGSPLVGVTVSAGAAATEATGAGGRFRLLLPNGSYELSARPLAGPLAEEFSPVTLALSVNGAGASVNFTLPRTAQSLEILAVDAETGLGVGGAAGSLVGNTSYGTPQRFAVTADGGGAISVSLPSGNYTVSLNASGYEPASATFAVNGSTPPVLVDMVPVGSGHLAQGGITAPEVEWGVAAAIGGAAVVLFTLGRRSARARRDPESTEGGPGESPGESEGTEPADAPVGSLPPE